MRTRLFLVLKSLAMLWCSGAYETNRYAKLRSCIAAEREPIFDNQTDCYPLAKLVNSFCQYYGFQLEKYVKTSRKWQLIWNKSLWDLQKQYDAILSKAQNFSTSVECLDRARFLGCYSRFQECDSTTSVLKPKTFCKETCIVFKRKCGVVFKAFQDYYLSRNPHKKSLFSCASLPERNAGDSPECKFYAKSKNESFQKEDCLYMSGNSYHGNISVTASGITCQSWREQCPHRHTMNTTYPELNLAMNYCRNIQDSGARPWCFTTDKNKRWEYCSIPKCTPVHGGYSNWSLNSSCSVTCGKGLEVWSRECDNPKPKYGGRNCNELGKATKYRQCVEKPCVVNGGYSTWYLNSPCNVSCGQGVETWRRSCDNPTPKNGGHNCSALGENAEYRNCIKPQCPIDGNYSNWTKSSECSVTCGVGYEIWSRKCDNPLPKYGGDCSKYGKARKSRPCHVESCPGTSSNEVIKITCGVCAAFVVIVAAGVLFRKRKELVKWFNRQTNFSPYAVVFFKREPDQSLVSNAVTSSEEHIYESISEMNLMEVRLYESISELNNLA